MGLQGIPNPPSSDNISDWIEYYKGHIKYNEAKQRTDRKTQLGAMAAYEKAYQKFLSPQATPPNYFQLLAWKAYFGYIREQERNRRDETVKEMTDNIEYYEERIKALKKQIEDLEEMRRRGRIRLPER